MIWPDGHACIKGPWLGWRQSVGEPWFPMGPSKILGGCDVRSQEFVPVQSCHISCQLAMSQSESAYSAIADWHWTTSNTTEVAIRAPYGDMGTSQRRNGDVRTWWHVGKIGPLTTIQPQWGLVERCMVPFGGVPIPGTLPRPYPDQYGLARCRTRPWSDPEAPGGIFPNSITWVVPDLSGRRCQLIRDETPSVTSLLAQQHGVRQPMRYEFADFGTEFWIQEHDEAKKCLLEIF